MVTRTAPVQTPNQRVLQPRVVRKIEAPVVSRKRRSTSRAAASPKKNETGDSRFKLQAIAWSIDPKQRIVVINGQVLREGDAVDGVLVSKIGRDEVIVKDGLQLRKLIFRVQ